MESYHAREILWGMLTLIRKFDYVFEENSSSAAYVLISQGSNLVSKMIQELPEGELRQAFVSIKAENAPMLLTISSRNGSLNDVLDFLKRIETKLGTAVANIEYNINRRQTIKRHSRSSYHRRF